MARTSGRRPPMARQQPARDRAATATAQAWPGDTRPAGIGLPGLRPRSRGASTMSLSDPIETWRAVIATPSRSAVIASAPATMATAPATSAVEQTGKRMGEADQAAKPVDAVGAADPARSPAAGQT